ncbi:peptide chain release factor N(5)-glutamine methyltransferase [Ornithinibacillus halotolerans]|nr:peptide chain release factor N(5)-glutamine methyltransferase [Ornithinibacillus halotolerans]
MSKKQYEVLNWASLFLEKNNRERRVADLLLQHHLGVNRTQYFAQMREDIPREVIERFQEDIMNHVETGVPVQHLIGYEEFYGRKFFVNNHVLIPRQETEELVQRIISQTAKDIPVTIVDVGTGSGIIATTLALEIPHATVYATDISQEALRTAERNANNLQARVTFLQGDFLAPVIAEQIQADMVVSNPPYISEAERPELSDTVVNFDPELALFAKDNGLAAYKQIVKQLHHVMKPGGLVAFEIGYLQGEDVKQIINEEFPYVTVTVEKDMNGKDRMVFATGF